MTINLSAAARASELTALLTAIGGAATITVYTGAIPAYPESAATGTVLATYTGPAPFGAVSTVAGSGATPGTATLTMGAVPQVSATGSGTAGWARIATSGGVAIMDVDVTATGGGGAFTFTTTAFVAGSPITLSSGTLTLA